MSFLCIHMYVGQPKNSPQKVPSFLGSSIRYSLLASKFKTWGLVSFNKARYLFNKRSSKFGDDTACHLLNLSCISPLLKGWSC